MNEPLIMGKIHELQQRVRWMEHQRKVSRRFEIAILACWLFVCITQVAAMVWRIK